MRQKKRNMIKIKNIDTEPISKGNLPHIYVSAMIAIVMPNFRIMRVDGHIGGRNVNIFIDCRSSHNFIHFNTIKLLGG